MNSPKFFLYAVCFICAVILSGCALTQEKPDVQLPKDIPAEWAADVRAENLPITSSLLDLINDQHLRELVQEALDNNPNLKATALRLKAAGCMLSIPRSRLLPQVNAEFSKERNNQGTDAETGGNITENAHRLSLGISWEIDIWGRLADEYAASEYAVFSEEYEYLYARDGLAARVIQAWIEQAAVQKSLAIEAERTDVLKRIETVLIDRYKNGIGNPDELSAAKTRTEIAKADWSERNAEMLRAIRKLEVLLGRYPRGELLSGANLPAVKSPCADVPAAALLKRPDIRAALARAESAKNASSAAEKAMLPELRLSGQVFKESARLGNIGGGTAYWGILGSLFQPLFEGGRIMNESRARRAETEAALTELHEAVLQALKEAEDAFDLERELAVQANALKIALRESEKSSQYYEERYRQGLDTIQNLLIAKEQEILVKIRLNETEAKRLINRIDLSLAVGAGLNDELTTPPGDTAP